MTTATSLIRPVRRSYSFWAKLPMSPSKTADMRSTPRNGFRSQLRAAEDRIAELEAQAEAYRQEAERGQQWLHRVYTEIEERFLRRADDRRGTPQRSQSSNRP